MNTPDTGTALDLDALEIDVASFRIGLGPWCEQYCYSALRHVNRNCEIDCPREDEHDCRSFSGYDGPAIARVVSASPALVAEVRRLRAENERLDALWAETTNDAICETDRANGAEEENERLREAVARVESTCGFVAEMAAVADVAGPPATIVVAMAKDILALLHGEQPRATADLSDEQ